MFELDVKKRNREEGKEKEHSSGLGFWYHRLEFQVATTQLILAPVENLGGPLRPPSTRLCTINIFFKGKDYVAAGARAVWTLWF